MKLLRFSFLILAFTCFAFSQNNSLNQTQFNLDSLRFFTSKNNNLQLIFNKSVLRIVQDSFSFKNLNFKNSTIPSDFNLKNFSIVKDDNGKNFFVRSDLGEVFSIENDSIIRKDFSKRTKAFSGANMIFHQNKILSFFGYGFFEERNFVIEFDFQTKQWDKIINDKDSYRPIARRNSIYHKKADKVYFLGGTHSNISNPTIHIYDMMAYDITNKKFKKMGDLKDKPNFFNINPKFVYRIDDTKSLFFKNGTIFLVNFELLNYRIFSGLKAINNPLYVVIIKDTLYYLNSNNMGEFRIENMAITDLFENFSEPKDLLEKVYVTQKTKRNILLLALIAFLLFIIIRLLNLRKFKVTQILKQGHYITFKNIIIPLTAEESQIMELLMEKSNVQLNQIFQLGIFSEYSDSYIKIYVPKLIDQLKNKTENYSNYSGFNLKLTFTKNKFDKRIKELSLKGDIKAYNGWFFYIFNF